MSWHKGPPDATTLPPVPPELVTEAHRALEQLTTTSRTNVIAFSGGKDSIVAAHLARQVGIRRGISEQSFTFDRDQPDYRAAADAVDVRVTWQTSLDDAWLARHPWAIFGDQKDLPKLHTARQQATVKNFAAQEGYTGVVYGRRTQENTVPDHVYALKDGLIQCHPLRNWTTDHVWRYLADHQLPYPQLYHHPIGDLFGAAYWPILSRDWLAREFPEHTPETLIDSYQPDLLPRLAWIPEIDTYLKETRPS